MLAIVFGTVVVCHATFRYFLNQSVKDVVEVVVERYLTFSTSWA